MLCRRGEKGVRTWVGSWGGKRRNEKGNQGIYIHKEVLTACGLDAVS